MKRAILTGAILLLSVLALGFLGATMINAFDNRQTLAKATYSQTGGDTTKNFEAFLRIEGIPGEATDKAYKGWIAVESFSWKETWNTTELYEEMVNMEEFHFSMNVSKASPKLFLAAASGQYFESAVLAVRTVGATPTEFLRWRFTKVQIVSYQTSGNIYHDATPVDKISIEFDGIEISYRQIFPDGTVGPWIKASWPIR